MATQVKVASLQSYRFEQRRLIEELNLNTGKSPEQRYEERERLVRDAIALREPSRVPVLLTLGYFSAKYVGIPTATAYYDPIRYRAAVRKTIIDMEPDIFQSSNGNSSGEVMDALLPTQTRWPGGPLPDNVSHQAI